MIVTAAQSGSVYNGMVLRVWAVTGAKPVATQTGAAYNNQFANAVTFTGAITTTAGSNVYGGSSRSQPSEASTGSNVTIVDDVSDATNSMRYITFKALNVTGAQTTRGYTISPSSASGPFAMFEILAATTLAEDASAAGAVQSTTSATSVQTPDFTPPAGCLLVAAVGSDGNTGICTVTVSDQEAVHLNWTQKSANYNTAGYDYAGVWIADVPAGGTNATAPASLYAAGTVGLPGVTAAGNVSSSGPNYGGSAADLGGGAGSWTNPGGAAGTDDSSYASWVVP